jgi:hypothetical protein
LGAFALPSFVSLAMESFTLPSGIELRRTRPSWQSRA